MQALPTGTSSTDTCMQFLEPREILAVLRAAKAKGTREWAMTLLAYKHGMRASEVCNLRLADVDLRDGYIVIKRLKGSLRTTQAVTEHRGEPLLNEQRALREWLRERRNDGSDFLFISQKGGRLHRSQLIEIIDFNELNGKWRKRLINADFIESIDEHNLDGLTVCNILTTRTIRPDSIVRHSFLHKGTMRELQLRIGVATHGSDFTAPIDYGAIREEWSQKKKKKPVSH